MENLADYFLNIIVNVNFFGDLKFEYYWALPKVDGRGHEIFSEKITGPSNM